VPPRLVDAALDGEKQNMKTIIAQYEFYYVRLDLKM
jgi:hypothetical protein